MKWFYLNIKPNREIGGIRYSAMIKAESVPDAIEKFQPRLDSLNGLIRRSIKSLTCDPFEVNSVSCVDSENVNQQWVIDTANNVIARYEDDLG